MMLLKMQEDRMKLQNLKRKLKLSFSLLLVFFLFNGCITMKNKFKGQKKLHIDTVLYGSKEIIILDDNITNEIINNGEFSLIKGKVFANKSGEILLKSPSIEISSILIEDSIVYKKFFRKNILLKKSKISSEYVYVLRYDNLNEIEKLFDKLYLEELPYKTESSLNFISTYGKVVSIKVNNEGKYDFCLIYNSIEDYYEFDFDYNFP